MKPTIREITQARSLSIILDPEIYDRISDDNSPILEECVFPAINAKYIGGFLGDQLIGLYVVHDGLLHFMVLKNHRKHSRTLLELSHKFHGKPVRIEVPELYQSVINFSRNNQFNFLFMKKRAHTKNGITYDVQVLERT